MFNAATMAKYSALVPKKKKALAQASLESLPNSLLYWYSFFHPGMVLSTMVINVQLFETVEISF